MESVELMEVSPIDEHVLGLIAQLDEFHFQLYGDVSCHVDSGQQLHDKSTYMVGAFCETKLIGIGAIEIKNGYGQLKRMFVKEEYRGKKVAPKLMNHLEKYLLNQSLKVVFLETGNLQIAAHKFYLKNGYNQVTSFDTFSPNDVSLYFKKNLE